MKTQNGQEHFTQLVDMYWRNVWAFVYASVRDQHVANDLTQDVFVIAYTRLYQLRDPSVVKSWLFSIARNRCSDYRKSAWFRRVSLVQSPEVFERGEIGWDPQTEHIESDTLWRSVFHLHLRYREVILLRFREDLEFHEIAAILRVPEGTVRSRYRRALHQLRQIWQDGGETSEPRKRTVGSDEGVASPGTGCEN